MVDVPLILSPKMNLSRQRENNSFDQQLSVVRINFKLKIRFKHRTCTVYIRGSCAHNIFFLHGVAVSYVAAS